MLGAYASAGPCPPGFAAPCQPRFAAPCPRVSRCSRAPRRPLLRAKSFLERGLGTSSARVPPVTSRGRLVSCTTIGCRVTPDQDLAAERGISLARGTICQFGFGAAEPRRFGAPEAAAGRSRSRGAAELRSRSGPQRAAARHREAGRPELRRPGLHASGRGRPPVGSFGQIVRRTWLMARRGPCSARRVPRMSGFVHDDRTPDAAPRGFSCRSWHKPHPGNDLSIWPRSPGEPPGGVVLAAHRRAWSQLVRAD